MKHTLRKYTTAEEVFNRVSASLKSYTDSDMIIFDEYYKVIELCNSRLGMRINPTKEAFLTIDDYQAELPEDFLLLELGLVVGKYTHTHQMGTSTISTLSGEVMLDDEELSPCCTFSVVCGTKPKLIYETETFSMEFEDCYIARLTEKKWASSNCFNLYSNSEFMMEIRNGVIYIDSVKDGHLYLLYTSSMKGKDAPICLDHPVIMEYYEQAVKLEIMKNLYINKRLEIAQAIQMIDRDHIIAKNAAISLASMPEFDELISINNALKRDFRKYNYYIY